MAQPTAISRYQIRDRLGHGGMGVLYLALDPAIDRLVAVKLLRVNNPEIRERFIREAQIAARLQHPHIVTVYDVGTHEGQPFIAMEYIAGETLGELIHRKAPLAISRRIELIADVCEGLAYAHKRGVVHRDIKPANLMVSRESGNVKILDFGIARTAGSNLTQVGMVMGTPNYMSPEQIAGRAVDHKSDIFAVGAVLYEVLAHKQAFGGETPHAVLHQITTVEPPRVTSVNTDLDPELDRILERAMAKAPAARYTDLLVMRADLLKVTQRLEAQQEGHTIVGEIAELPGRVTPTPTPRSARAGPDRARIAERRAVRIATHLQSAEAALAAGALEDALAEVELGAEIEPDDPRIVRLHERVRAAIDARDGARLLQEARARLAEGALTLAGSRLGEASQLVPASPDVQSLMRDLERAHEQRERLREQMRHAQEAVALAREYLEGGALDAALRASSEALGYRPDDAEALEVRRTIREAIDRRNQEAVAEARREAARGHHDTAIRLLQAVRPPDDAVSELLSELEATRAQAERERAAREQALREQAAREQQEREQAAREHTAREQAFRDQAERERAERQRAEQARAEEERADEARRRAFGNWVASHVEALDTALDEGRWADAREVLRVLDARASDTPGLVSRRERLDQGVEMERRERAVHRLLAEARSCLGAGEYDNAERAVEEALRIDPSGAQAAEVARDIADARAGAERRVREHTLLEAGRASEEALNLANTGDVERALARLEQAPPLPIVHETRAQVAEIRARRDEEARKREAQERAAREAQEARREAARRAEAARALEREREQARGGARARGSDEDTVDAAVENDDTLESDAPRVGPRSGRQRRPDRPSTKAQTPAPIASAPAPLLSPPPAPLDVIPRPRAPIPGPTTVRPRPALSARQWIAAAAVLVIVFALGAWLWSRVFSGGQDEGTRARAAIADARTRFERGDQVGALTLLERYTPSRPEVQQALEELRKRRTPPPQPVQTQPPVQTLPETPPATTPPTTTPPATTPAETPAVTPPAVTAVQAIEAAAVRAEQAGDTTEALRQALLGLAREPTNQTLASIARGIVTRAAADATAAQRRAAAIAGASDLAAFRNAAQESLRSSLLPLSRANEAVDGYRRAVQSFDRAATERQAAITAEEARVRQLEEQRRQRADDVRTQTLEAQRLLREQKWAEALEVLKKVRALDPAAPGLDQLVRQGEAGLNASRQPPPQTRPPTANAPDPVEAVRTGVTQLLEAFKRGYEARDLAAIRRIWPSIPNDFVNSYARLFRDNTTLSWQYQLQKLAVATDYRAARAQCRVQVGQQGDRRSGSEERTYVFDVVSAPGGWQITGLAVTR